MLNEEMHRYTELSGNSAEHESIQVIGAYLDGYDKGVSDVRENVKGEWQPIEVQPYFKKHFDTSVACSVCHRKGNKRWHYCPHCGADMRGVKHD